MMVSTKGRYALRVMIDLAQHEDEGFQSLKSVAERQNISMKYLEMIVAILNRGGFVQSLRGKDGGYKLTRPAGEYTVGSVIRLAEGSLAPVACLDCEDVSCHQADHCLTLPMWRKLDDTINSYLDSITVADLQNGNV